MSIQTQADLPEFLQGPVVCGPVLLILDLHGYDGAGEGAPLPLIGHAGRQEVRGQRGVQRVRQQHELELHLQVLSVLATGWPGLLRSTQIEFLLSQMGCFHGIKT